jgi:uncharacterized membrane protein YbhN (UPF0104 family)
VSAAARLQRRILYGVLAGALVYAAVAVYADLDALARDLGEFSWWSFAAALGLVSVNYLLRFVRWQIYLQRLEIFVPWRRSLLIFLAGFVMSVSPGKVGEVLKSALLARSDGVPVARSAPVVLAERVTDLLALILLAATGVSTYRYGATALWVTAALVLGGVALLSSRAAGEAALGLIGRLPLGAKFAPRLREAWVATRALLAPGLTLGLTGLSALSWGLEAVAFWVLLRGFGAVEAATLPAATFVYAITTILGAVSFLPGGLGVTEASMISALQLLGLVAEPSVASAVTLLARLATLWWAVAVGAVAFALFARAWAPSEEGHLPGGAG